MYHISKDKRAEQSSELIYNGLLKCIKKKPFEQITISDLQKASGVARSTFYRAFDNISDVLYWRCDACFAEVLLNYQPKPNGGELDLAKHYFTYWLNHSDILELLIQINRIDIIYACHMKNAEIMQQRFGKLPGLNVEHGNYFIAIRTGFTISILTVWLKGGRKETPEELVQIIKE
ncbi:MAG: TetR/AcrR family transcriptional regulator, partial [Ruminiclostridium sp.]